MMGRHWSVGERVRVADGPDGLLGAVRCDVALPQRRLSALRITTRWGRDGTANQALGNTERRRLSVAGDHSLQASNARCRCWVRAEQASQAATRERIDNKQMRCGW
jgi:hypothetical protein